MRRLIRCIPAAGLLLTALIFVGPSAGRALDGGRFGAVREFEPDGELRGVVIMFSDHGGWRAADSAAASQVAAAGALVVGIDTPSYIAHLDKADKSCRVLIGDAEAMSRAAQRELNAGPYLFPILAGVGEGGTVAAVILAQARINTVAGAVSVDPAPAISSIRPPCSDVSQMTVAADAAEQPPAGSQGYWSVGLRPGSALVLQDRLTRWETAGLPITSRNLVSAQSDLEALVALVVPHLRSDSSAAGNCLASLPLIPMPAEHPGGVLAVVLSGDGGWRDIDKKVTDELRARGVSVIGWDSLRYFWHRKTPDQVAADLAEVIRSYSVQWRSKRVALIGYSFGADVLPFAFNRLPHDLQANVAMITLLAFSSSADFEISVGGLLGAPASVAALPVAADVARIPGGLIQCFYGRDEPETGCTGLPSGAEVIRTPGGHHFDRDYTAVTNRITDGLASRRSW